MSTLALVDAFRALRTPSARIEALTALAGELSPHEWRQLKALASAKSLQLDIVGALPVELAFHVFSYLDIATPFRLQSVRHLPADKSTAAVGASRHPVAKNIKLNYTDMSDPRAAANCVVSRSLDAGATCCVVQTFSNPP